MIAEGFNVHGFDASTHMLEALQTKAHERNIKTNVWQSLIENVQLKEKYKLIFIPSGSFDLIIDLQKAKEALAKIYSFLLDDGLFVFEAITPHWKAAHLNIWTGDVWHREDGKFILSNFLTLPDRDNIRRSIGRYELIDGNRLIQTEIEDFKVRLYDKDELSVMLKTVGFKEINMVKAYDHNKHPESNDEVVIFECRK